MENKTPTFLNLSSAIIIGATILAIAIIYTKKPAEIKNPKDNNQITKEINLLAVSPDEHIFGNPNADIKMVEYSDPLCYFCNTFNPTLSQIMEKYGPSGKVAWVYRHFPLDASSDKAFAGSTIRSTALECSASGGNNKFWEYQKKLYSLPAPASENISDEHKLLIATAKDIGLNTIDFAECLSDPRTKEKIISSLKSGIDAKVTGTPTTFFVLEKTINQNSVDYINNALIQYRVPNDMLYIASDKRTIVMSGAMPIAMVEGIIESLVK